MSQTRHRVEIPARSPGSGGPPRASGPLPPLGGGDAAGLSRYGPALEYRGGHSAGPAPTPPDFAGGPALDSPGTIAYSPRGPGTPPRALGRGGVPGPAASS